MNPELQERFPELTPITSPPTLFSINGIGLMIYGKRDFDPETTSYVKTQCLVVLLLPLFFLRAYRVIDAPSGGWYFLGRSPLSSFAKVWNLILLTAIVGGIGFGSWYAYTHTPDYLAGQKLNEAQRLKDAGQIDEAATIYRGVYEGRTSHREFAKQKLTELILEPSTDLKRSLGVFRIALELNRKNELQLSNLFEVGWKAATQDGAPPQDALAILDLLAPLAPRPQEVQAKRLELLEKIHSSDPTNLNFATQLARLYHQKGQREKARTVLAPFGDALIGTPAAGIMGQIHSETGNFAQAIELLRPYVDANLPKVRSASDRLKPAINAAQERAFRILESGKAPGISLEQIKNASRDEQAALVRPFVYETVMNDPDVRAAQNDLAAANEVVPAVIDLGMAHLQKAQASTKPDERTAELKKAEETLLSVQTVAGEEDEYKLSLGRVYYWLGKTKEGKKEFDELLATRQRAPIILMAVASTLREIGASGEARKLAEEAHAKATTDELRYRAAVTRAVMFTDLDDEILWLGKCDPKDLESRAQLAAARGSKAEREGRREEAAAAFRDALATHAKLPENSATLNNSALINFHLYSVTGDPAEFARGTEKMDRAIALLPSNTILLHNASSTLLTNAIRDIASKSIDFQATRTRVTWEVIPFLHNDSATRVKVRQALASHIGFTKAKAYADKRLLLAPRDPKSYSEVLSFLTVNKPYDQAAFESLATRMLAAEFDLEEAKQDRADFLSGKHDPKRLTELDDAIKQLREVLPTAREKGGASFAWTVHRLIDTYRSQAGYGQTVKVDELVALAEEAVKLSPSAGSRDTLTDALFLRVHQKMIAKSPEYAALSKKLLRTVGVGLPHALLAAKSKLSDELRADPDVKLIQKTVQETAKLDPETVGITAWILFRGDSPELANAVVKRLKEDTNPRLFEAMEKLSSDNDKLSVWTYWTLIAIGDRTAAQKYEAALKEAGLPTEK